MDATKNAIWSRLDALQYGEDVPVVVIEQQPHGYGGPLAHRILGTRKSFRILSHKRRASAIMVIVGVSLPTVGNTELPAMKRLWTPCTSQSAPVTPLEGSSDIRVVPM